jgi:hypothetical protein
MDDSKLLFVVETARVWKGFGVKHKDFQSAIWGIWRGTVD